MVKERARKAGPRHDGEAAAFPVLEAILVALLIVTTIIFFTSLQRPTTGTDVGGIDLGRLSADTLDILQTKEFTKAGCLDAVPLEQWVGLVMNGTKCPDGTFVADEVEDFVSEVLPPGTRFQLRLGNGVSNGMLEGGDSALVLVPVNDTQTPRAARASATYITPNWTAFRGRTASAALQGVYPGQELSALNNVNATAFLSSATTAGSIVCIKSPTGSSRGPGRETWDDHWEQSTTHVPSDIPYGTWAGYTTADCSGSVAKYLHVGLRDGTKTDYPLYALQLVVWFGA